MDILEIGCMKYFVLTSHDPYYNLALEEYLFRTNEDEVFLLWQNDKTVVIGKNQNANVEVDIDFLRENEIKLARRITGGGAVYHDLGNLNYTFISRGEGGIDFAEFASPIIKALASLGIVAVLSGRNDIEVEGRKISGNAQHREGGRVLHHGTLLFDSDLTVLSRVLRPDEEKMRSKAVRSVRSRVANVRELAEKPITVDDLVGAILKVVKECFSPTELYISASDDEKIVELAKRNASPEWLYPERGVASTAEKVFSHRFPFGKVELRLSLRGELVSSAELFGDFFAEGNIDEPLRAIEGVKISELSSRLREMRLEEYIHGMTKEDAKTLLCIE